MCKVTIDAFESEEQAVAFVDWFRKVLRNDECNLITTDGEVGVEWDGVDINSSSEKVKVINITTFNKD